METIEIFLQGEGIRKIDLIHVSKNGTVRDILEAAKAKGSSIMEEQAAVFLENGDEELDLNSPIAKVGIHHRGRVHVHRCRKVHVTVNYNGRGESHDFSPASTIERIKKWAVSKKIFNLSDVDASEHILQICGSSERPDDDTHVGSLVTVPGCKVCFDLVAKVRIEG